jgi:hypothetical protein
MDNLNQVLEFVGKIYEEKLNALLATSEAINKHTKIEHRSENINELATALAKAQSEMPTAKKDSENPYFKSSYADLAEIVSVSRPCLSKNGLSVTQKVITNVDGSTMLHTVLMHCSGQWTESTMRVVPPKNDIQTISSYITYLKRINYAALIGVVAEAEDDDGEKAVATSRETFAKGVALNTKYNPREESAETVSKDQLDELQYELAEYPDIASQVLEGLKIQSIADIPKSKYGVSIRRIREIKQLRNTGI